jgi:hypothetical protein
VTSSSSTSTSTTATTPMPMPTAIPPLPTNKNEAVIHLSLDSTIYQKNGIPMSSDAAPYISDDNRTMTPLRLVSEALGALVEWDGETRTVTVILNGSALTIQIDQPLPNDMGTAVIKNDRTYVPIRYISENFGAQVNWDALTRSVEIRQS